MKPEQLKEDVIRAEGYAQGYGEGFKVGYLTCANKVAKQLQEEEMIKLNESNLEEK